VLLVTERGKQFDAQQASLRQYGSFSARYGNLYTPRQLLQLFDRAYGKFDPQERWWQIPGKGWADPFRPNIEPDGFATPELRRCRPLPSSERRQGTVRNSYDVFIFTLGLTEAWRCRRDGAVLPIVPGATAGAFCDADYEFVNFTYDEIVDDLEQFQIRLEKINPTAQVIYTVSPVPLVASYSTQHVAVATTASKSVLRAGGPDSLRRSREAVLLPVV
jgi:hypothetical protein